MKAILSLSQKKTFAHYAAYLLLLWLVHFIFISFISFFHFQLNHRVSVIEEWAFKNAWLLALATKGISGWLMMRFVLVKSDQRIFKRIWESSLEWWRAPDYIFVAVCFYLFFMLVNGRPEPVTVREFSLFGSLLSGVGTIVFYGSDLLIIFFLRLFYPLRRGELLFAAIVLSLMFVFANRGIYIYTQGIDGSAMLCFLILYFLSVLEKNRLIFPLLFLIPLAFLAAIFGVDLLWGEGQSYWQMTDKITFSSVAVAAIIIVNYISMKRIGLKPYMRYLRLLGWALLLRPFVKIRRKKDGNVSN